MIERCFVCDKKIYELFLEENYICRINNTEYPFCPKHLKYFLTVLHDEYGDIINNLKVKEEYKIDMELIKNKLIVMENNDMNRRRNVDECYYCKKDMSKYISLIRDDGEVLYCSECEAEYIKNNKNSIIDALQDPINKYTLLCPCKIIPLRVKNEYIKHKIKSNSIQDEWCDFLNKHCFDELLKDWTLDYMLKTIKANFSLICSITMMDFSHRDIKYSIL